MRVPIRRAAPIAALLALTACGGSPAPAPTDPPAPPPCTPDTGTVDWDEPTSTPSLLHVVARYRDDTRTTWRDLLDRPFTPEVTGDGTDRSWIPTLARSLGERHNLSLGPDSSPGDELTRLHTMLENSTQHGWLLAYSGTTLVEAGFRVTCGTAAPTPITGTLTTWNSMDSGFLSCADQDARDDPAAYPDAWDHCPTD
ncbi:MULTISPECIES: hypothetical protein [Catenuloplanes]|uniref:Lipoprotein n=1 Tax=Catenuloplanes niger TaxID=587534 RepID=A0AAE3ZSN7_9ACTN|nr:hypothetical protein [Catenuloplanes niger]MDR7325339.1 hypothetical protein [Catenuloplanes niger]